MDQYCVIEMRVCCGIWLLRMESSNGFEGIEYLPLR